MSTSKEILKKFAESADLSYMQAMVADGTIKDIDEPFNEYGRTALMYQCLFRNNKGYLERVRFLLGCHPPAKINIQDSDGDTCLHLAVYGGDDPDLVRLLVENGADRSIKNCIGRTALDIAKEKKFDKSVEVLENYFPLLNSNGNSEKNRLDREKAEKDRLRREKAEKDSLFKESVTKKGILLKFKAGVFFGFGSSWQEKFVYCDDENIKQFHESSPNHSSKLAFLASLKSCKVESVPHLREFAFTITNSSSSSGKEQITLAAEDETTYISWMSHLERYCDVDTNKYREIERKAKEAAAGKKQTKDEKEQIERKARANVDADTTTRHVSTGGGRGGPEGGSGGISLSLHDYGSLKVDVDELLRSHASVSSWLVSLDKSVDILVGKSEECPRLVWFYSKDPSCKDWLKDPMKFLLNDRLMVVFVCPVTLQVVKCGPKGDGWEVRNPKEWVKKWGPAILMSLKVLNLAMKAGRVLGLPLPNVDVDGMIDNKLISSSLNKLASAFTSTLKQSIKGDVDSGIVSEDIVKLSGDAYSEIRTFLTTGDNLQLGPLDEQLKPHMIRCKGGDGAIEWVSKEGRHTWEDMHRRQKTGGGSVATTALSSPSSGFTTATSAISTASSSPSTSSLNSISVGNDFKSFIFATASALNLNITPDKIDKIVEALRPEEIESKDVFTSLSKEDLEDAISKSRLPLSIGLKASLKTIHAHAVAGSYIDQSHNNTSVSPRSAAKINEVLDGYKSLQEDNLKMKKELEDLKRNIIDKGKNDVTSTSDVTLDAGGGSSMKQVKAQANSKSNAMQDSSGVDSTVKIAQMEVQIAGTDKKVDVLASELQDLKDRLEERLDVNHSTSPSASPSSNDDKDKHDRNKINLFRK